MRHNSHLASRADGSPAGRRPAESGEPGAFPPPPRHRFQGREAELGRLELLLRRHRAVRIQAAEGMGKSALAREAAYRWTSAGRYPDGACWVSFEHGAGADHVVNTLGTYLEGTRFERVAVPERPARARELFDQRRVLMVWDGFENAPRGGLTDDERDRVLELLRAWTRDTEGSGRLLLTCSPAEGTSACEELAGVAELSLPGLARPDARRLLESTLDLHPSDGREPRCSPSALETLVGSLDGHPLSIEIVARLLEGSAPEELSAELEELRESLGSEASREGWRALRASLELAGRRLGEPVRRALSELGLFRGGVFESLWLEIGGLEPGVWEAVRRDLEAMGLVRVGPGAILHEDRPYLGLHPAIAASAAAAPAVELRERFVGAYHGLATTLWQIFFQSRGRHRGLDVMAREEGNFRTAARWAVEAEVLGAAADLGDLLGETLQRSGRSGEQERWSARLAAAMGRRGYGEEAARKEHEAAWALFNHARGHEAVARLERLLERLRAAESFDPALLTAQTRLDLGRIYHARGQANRAIPLLEDAAAAWEAAADRQAPGLIATLSLLAQAWISTGQPAQALSRLERAARLADEAGEPRKAAAAWAQMAEIVLRQERLEEADRWFGQALEAARRAGDRKLEAGLLQHRGSLAELEERWATAADLYRRALDLFHQLDDASGLLQTCNLLGVLGRKTGHLEPARGWFEQALELARQAEDREMVGITAQNLGVVWRLEGEAAGERGEKTAARECFERAGAGVDESVSSQRELGDRRGLAAALGQLAQIRLLLGDSEQAEELSHEAREIREQLGAEEVWQDYDTLADVARARGDEAAAFEWEAKRDAVLAELERRRP